MTNDSTWEDPRLTGVTTFFSETVRQAPKGRKTGRCRNAKSGHVVMVNPTTGEPFKVPCMSCNPGND